MNIHEALLEEHSKTQALKIANYACSSKKYFKELMECFTDKDHRIAQRAAWSVSWAAEKKKELVIPYIPVLVEQLSKTDVHDAVIRNSLRVLQYLKIPEAFHADVMNACFSFVEDINAPGAFKAFSLTILQHLSTDYPEIKNELKLIIEDRWENEKPSFRARAKQILKSL